MLFRSARILKAYLKELVELLLVYSLEPVIHLKLATSLTVVALNLTIGGTFYRTASRAVILLRFVHIFKNILLTRSVKSILELTFLSIIDTTFSISATEREQNFLPHRPAILT